MGQLAENSAAILDQFSATEFTVSIPEGRMNGVRNPETILGANSDIAAYHYSVGSTSSGPWPRLTKVQHCHHHRNGYRGDIKKLSGTNNFHDHDCEALVQYNGSQSVFACAGKNNQGLMSKFSPAWALMFSIARDAQGTQTLLVKTVLCLSALLQGCLPSVCKILALVIGTM